MSVTNPSVLQQSSSTSSLSLFKANTATITVVPNPSDNYQASGIVAIPHFMGTDRLLWQVATFSSTQTVGNNIPTPFCSNDGRIKIFAYVDETNLYIECAANSVGLPWTTFTVDVYYRIMVP